MLLIIYLNSCCFKATKDFLRENKQPTSLINHVWFQWNRQHCHVEGYCQGPWWHVQSPSKGEPSLPYSAGRSHLLAWDACLQQNMTVSFMLLRFSWVYYIPTRQWCINMYKKPTHTTTDRHTQRCMRPCIHRWGMHGARSWGWDGYEPLVDTEDVESKYYHLNPSWEGWNKQSSFYSGPSPTWQ